MDDDQSLLIIGWDSAAYELIDGFETELNTLEQVKSKGVYGDLRTVYPPGTVPGWPCITTGMNPGKINTQSLAPFRKDEFQPNTGEENIEIWDVVNHFGGTACVINIPTVIDAYHIDGAMVSGFLSTEESTDVSPNNLIDSLDLDVDLHLAWEDVDREADIFTAAMDIAEQRFDLVLALMDAYDWDFFIVNFDAPDRIAHSRLKYIDTEHPFYSQKGNERYGGQLQACYERLDTMLAELVKKSSNIFIISDHGMDSCYQRFNINDWLINEGYLVLDDDESIVPGLTTRLLGTVKRVITEHGLIRYVPDLLKRKSVVSKFENTQHISDSNVDWEATTAYMSAVYGGIDVIAGERIKNELTSDLESLERPSMTVIDSSELYHGPNIENVPDLFLEFDDHVLPTNQVGASQLVEASSTGGKHSMDGIFAAAGPAIEQVGEITAANVMDITPTALHLLGLPIPENIDGDILDILATDQDPEVTSLNINLKKGREEMSEKERNEVMQTLEDIGYI